MRCACVCCRICHSYIYSANNLRAHVRQQIANGTLENIGHAEDRSTRRANPVAHACRDLTSGDAYNCARRVAIHATLSRPLTFYWTYYRSPFISQSSSICAGRNGRNLVDRIAARHGPTDAGFSRFRGKARCFPRIIEGCCFHYAGSRMQRRGHRRNRLSNYKRGALSPALARAGRVNSLDRGHFFPISR